MALPELHLTAPESMVLFVTVVAFDRSSLLLAQLANVLLEIDSVELNLECELFPHFIRVPINCFLCRL